MRFVSTVVIASFFALPLALAACGGDDDADDESFDSLQDCFTDHHDEEMLTVPHAITVCCLDHPINGMKKSCGSDQATCETHVRTELPDTTEVTSADITTACTDYVSNL